MTQQRIILITGAASGIGLQTAKQFVDAGARVIATDINEAALQQNAAELGENYQPLLLNVAKEEHIKAAFELINKEFGRLDSLVNNAAVAGMNEPEQLTAEQFDFEMDINLKGPMLLVKYFAPLLRKSDNGSVVNICSVAAIIEAPGHFLYSAAKVGLKKFSEDCARAVLGVRHNNILPGVIDTPILDLAYKEHADIVRKTTAETAPVGRTGKPEDIANAVEFLCSDKATYINGATLVVDGGIRAASSSPLPI